MVHDSSTVAFAFPGQGSQRPGMGAALFPRHRETVRVANDVLGYSIEELCLAKDGRLNRTEYTQPAIFVVNALNYAEMLAQVGESATHALGHSVGEYNALHVADVFDFATGLHIVKKRGELMSRCPAGGAMAALIGEREKLLAYVRQSNPDVYLANDNSPRQIVVAGKQRAIARLEEQVRQRGLGESIPLSVSGAFHSPLMADAKVEFAEFISAQKFRAAKLCVVSNVSALPHVSERLASCLADHLIHPVRWLESIQYLLAQGPLLFHEFGSGRILSALFHQITACIPSSTGGQKNGR
jgi:malonyl CoA-acyl carrier protein transacylase